MKTYQYDAFGNIVAETGTLENPFAYTGREWEPELGLYYYRARWYDPVIGRFLSEDPIGFTAGDPNIFRYVFNNPVNLIDPFGLHWMIDPRTGQPMYHSHGNDEPGWSGGGSGPVTPALPSGTGNEAFNEIATGVGAAYGVAGGIMLAPGVISACFGNPVACANAVDFGINFADEFSGALGGPTTGLLPMTPAGQAGALAGKISGKIVNECVNE